MEAIYHHANYLPDGGKSAGSKKILRPKENVLIRFLRTGDTPLPHSIDVTIPEFTETNLWLTFCFVLLGIASLGMQDTCKTEQQLIDVR